MRITNGNWHQFANCATTDPDLFFPEPGGDSARCGAMARKICAACDVIEFCKNAAMDNREEFGIWAGMGVKARRRLRTAA